MSGAVEIVVILAAVCFVMVRRLMGEPAQAKRMIILPGILMVVGLTDLSGQIKTVSEAGFLVATLAISVVLGALRGASVRISQQNGVAFVRYTWLTLVLWVANLVIKFGANFALKAIDPKDAGAVSNSLLLTLGAGLLVEGLVVLYRALRSDHQVMWAKGKNGAPQQMSPFLENMRQSLNGRGEGWNAGRSTDWDAGQDTGSDWNQDPGASQQTWDSGARRAARRSQRDYRRNRRY